MISEPLPHCRVWFLLLLLLGGCGGLRMPVTSALDRGAWTMSGGGAERRNASEAPLALPLTLTWTYDAEAGFGPASPLVSGGFVLVGTRKGAIHAIRLQDGKRQGSVSVGESIEGASALVPDGFVGAAATGKRPLFRYDLLSGGMTWRAGAAPVLAGLLPDARLLVVADAEGGVSAYEARTGAQRWTHRAEQPATFRAAPVATASGIFVADDRGEQWLLDRATGGVRWHRRGAGPVYGTPAARGDTLFVPTTRGRLEALAGATGEVLWQLVLADTTVRLAAPAVAGRELVLAGTDGIVRMLDAATGAERWSAATDGAVVAPPLLTRDAVFVGTMARQLLALSRYDGAVLWEYELRGRMKSAMAVAGRSLIVLSEPRHVYRFDPATP